MRYLLIGNPNVGKSSVFNLLSTTYAHVGNYGGITVDKKVGRFVHGELIDLPGTYSILPNSVDEGVCTHSLLHDGYDGIINIVDSTHLKRNLHLSIQLLELGVPIIIVANFIDELQQSGKIIDFNRLGEELKCPVIGFSARTKVGIDDLTKQLKTTQEKAPLHLYYGPVIENAIAQLVSLISIEQSISKRWVAIQLLEGNEQVLEITKQMKNIIMECEKKIIEKRIALSLKGAIFNYRRGFINRLMKDCLVEKQLVNKTKIFNQRIDRWITHPFIGFIIFVFVMFGVYFLTFDFLGTIISHYIEIFINQYVHSFFSRILTLLGAKENSILMSLVGDGIVQGVGGILVFVPQIGILFLLLAIIEATGYMARVAIMLDTILSKFGLNGKSIVPLITGLGCNVPAIMATRTISDKKERMLTMAILPFMSCTARIPIYALMASLFFPQSKAIIILSMYLVGTIIALMSAKFLSLTLFKRENSNFILEIPPYRLPKVKNVYRHTKLMITDFIKKAGKFILVGTVILWFLQYMGPRGIALANDQSFLGYIGSFFAPLLQPLGFGSWQATSSLIVGFLAKELIYSSMIVIYNGPIGVSKAFTGLSAYSFMIFSLLYLPCLAAVATIYQESKSYRFTLFVLSLTFIIAYFVCLMIFQVGNLIVT